MGPGGSHDSTTLSVELALKQHPTFDSTFDVRLVIITQRIITRSNSSSGESVIEGRLIAFNAIPLVMALVLI